MKGKRVFVNRGEVQVSDADILYTNISSCVCVCLYYPPLKIGGITHISNSYIDDDTPSGRLIKKEGYYYADKAIERLLYLFKKKSPGIRDKKIELVVAGGLDNEGPIAETMLVLKKYNFKQIGLDINQNVYRNVIYDTSAGIVTIERKIPFSGLKEVKQFFLMDRTSFI